MEDVKIIEEFENQIVRITTPKANKELLVRKVAGPSAFFEVVWGNEHHPKGLEGLYTSQSKAMDAVKLFLMHMKPSNTVNRDNHTKAREARKTLKKQKETTANAPEPNL